MKHLYWLLLCCLISVSAIAQTKADSLLELASQSIEDYSYSRAELYLQELLSDKYKPDELAKANALQLLGQIEFIKKNYPAAEKYYADCAGIYAGFKDSLSYYTCSLYAGGSAYAAGRQADWESAVNKAAMYAKSAIGTKERVSIYQAITKVSFDILDLVKAKENSDIVLRLAIENGYRNRQAEIFALKGKLSGLLGDFDMSITYVHKALDIYRLSGSVKNQAELLFARGVSEQEKGNHLVVQSTFSELAGLYDSLKVDALYYKTLYQKACIYEVGNQMDSALVYYRYASEIKEYDVVNSLVPVILTSELALLFEKGEIERAATKLVDLKALDVRAFEILHPKTYYRYLHYLLKFGLLTSSTKTTQLMDKYNQLGKEILKNRTAYVKHIGEQKHLIDKKGEMSLQIKREMEIQALKSNRDNIIRNSIILGFAFLLAFVLHRNNMKTRTNRQLEAVNRLNRKTNLQLKKQETLLTEKNDMLAKTHRQIQSELEMARKVQFSLLPRSFPDKAGVSFFGRLIPSESLSGDFYDVFEIGEGLIGMYMIDVCGHGVPSAMITVFISNIIDNMKTDLNLISKPSLVLDTINKRMVEADFENHRLKWFSTMFFAVYDSGTKTLRYSSAWHNTVYHIDNSGKSNGLQMSSFPLGWFDYANYEEKEITMKVEDKLLLITDGIIEADKDGLQFGEERFFESLKANMHNEDNNEIEDVFDAIIEDISTFTGKDRQEDDITMLLMKVTG